MADSLVWETQRITDYFILLGQPQCFEVFIFSLWSFGIMAFNKDWRSNFSKIDNAKVETSS